MALLLTDAKCSDKNKQFYSTKWCAFKKKQQKKQQGKKSVESAVSFYVLQSSIYIKFTFSQWGLLDFSYLSFCSIY